MTKSTTYNVDLTVEEVPVGATKSLQGSPGSKARSPNGSPASTAKIATKKNGTPDSTPAKGDKEARNDKKKEGKHKEKRNDNKKNKESSSSSSSSSMDSDSDGDSDVQRALEPWR